MSHARITVCIPAYNQPGFLREALSSLCDQGLDRSEYVVAISDDASPTSLKWVGKAFEGRLQIVYRRNASNIGHLANFEEASRLADTPYISFLPHDDLIAPGQLGRALGALAAKPGAVLVSSLVLCQKHPGAIDTAVHGMFLRGASAGRFEEPYLWDTAEWLALASVTTPLSIVGSVFQADVFRRCERWRAFPIWHDRLMLAEMGLHGRVISLPWIGGHYRVSGGQLSGQLWQKDLRELLDSSVSILAMCEAAGVRVADFWVDHICEAPTMERLPYLRLLHRGLPQELFDDIKARCERRLQKRLPMGRLDRLGMPKPVADAVRWLDRRLGT